MEPTVLLAPRIEESGMRGWSSDPEMAGILHQTGQTPAAMLRLHLETLAGGSPKSGIELGYSLSINVYDLFTRDPQGEWAFDGAKLQFFLDWMCDAGRGVVINLRANHFAGSGELAQELSNDETALAQTGDHAVIREYRSGELTFAPTFSQHESIRLNRFRLGGFAAASRMLAEFDRGHPGILRAVTLAGELHHYVPDMDHPGAPGRFAGVQMTDYSDASTRDFREWLRLRYPDLASLNQRCETPFSGWEEIVPPGFDLRTHCEKPRWMHMDSYADGHLPVFGWAELQPGDCIGVFLDENRLGTARQGLSRVDVYNALPHLTRADVGYRYELDYTGLAPGPHVIHVILEQPGGGRFLIGRRRISICESSFARRGAASDAFCELDSLPILPGHPGASGYVDSPVDWQAFLFNFYAFEWQQFRGFQVSSLLNRFAQIALENGLPPEKLFSHQIVPEYEGAWNYAAFATALPCGVELPFHAGFKLYDGTVMYRGITECANGRPYGVSECHPRLGRPESRDAFRQMLEFHRENGAAFICPYFMSIAPVHHTVAANRDFLIHPANPRFGSHFFYAAILEFLRG